MRCGAARGILCGVAAPEIFLVGVCVLCLGIAALAVSRLRMTLSKSRAATLSFAIPGVLALAPAAWLAAAGALFALVPLVTIAVLCFSAAALFTPTAATRFAAFERAFWAHVDRRG
jgi:hypothetical protein